MSVPLYVFTYIQNSTVPARLYHTDGNSLDAMPEGTEVYSYMIYLVGCVLAVG